MTTVTLRNDGKVLQRIAIDPKTQASVLKESALAIWKRLVQYAQADLNDKHELQNFRSLVEECMAWNGLVGVPEDLVGEKAGLIITTVAAGKRSTICNKDAFQLCDDRLTPEKGAIKYQKDFPPVLKWLARDPHVEEGARAQIGKQAALFLWEHGDENISLHLTIHTNTAQSFYSLKVARYGTIASPICRFILDRLDHYAKAGGKHDIIPLKVCVYCGKIIFFERSSRKTCGASCRVAKQRKGL
jgi:hypothetical protein